MHHEDRDQPSEPVVLLKMFDCLLDRRHQLFHFGFFLFGEGVAPASQWHSLSVDEGCKVKLLAFEWHVLDIEPLIPPADDGVLAGVLDEIDGALSSPMGKAASSDCIDGSPVAFRLLAHLEEALPEASVGSDAKVAFAECDEDDDMVRNVARGIFGTM